MAKLFEASLIALCTCFLFTHGLPWEPVPRPEDWWMQRHNEFVNTTRNNGSNINIVFTGSSSIEMWNSNGLAIWNAKYAPLGAVNYGIGGDSIEHCLWRIMNGEVENINPKILVLYCGSNNIRHPSIAEIVRGIAETLEELARRLPQTKILYVNINPRADVTPAFETFNKIIDINRQIQELHDGDKRIVFDMFYELFEAWGVVRRDLYENDKLHFNPAGYVHWDGSWNSTFFNLWNSD